MIRLVLLAVLLAGPVPVIAGVASLVDDPLAGEVIVTFAVQVLGAEPAHEKPASTTQALEQPSLSEVFPSSQASPETTTPSPQGAMTVKGLGRLRPLSLTPGPAVVATTV